MNDVRDSVAVVLIIMACMVADGSIKWCIAFIAVAMAITFIPKVIKEILFTNRTVEWEEEDDRPFIVYDLKESDKNA